MVKATNFYKNEEAISLTLKIKRLQALGVPFELEIVKGIEGEKYVALSCSRADYERALESEREF